MIAIVGMACRLPGASSPEELWAQLARGGHAIGPVPRTRWDADALWGPGQGRSATKEAGFIDDVDLFDHQLFGVSPREAEELDPQQRLLLELGWEALAGAGLPREAVAGTAADVFVGISSHDYLDILPPDLARATPWSGIGNALSIAANRLSYTFDLRGASMAVDTACSSSLVALHLACQRLRRHEAPLALVGGVSLMLSPAPFVALSAAGMLAPDGRCKAFSADADGYGRGEGAVLLVLKRLTDALADRDPVLAVICGSAINQDGRSNGITAPNGPAQVEVVRAALRDAGREGAEVAYVEAHGTGTPLGDPIEAQALAEALGEGRSTPLYIGSIKTGIGHLEAAAGIAGLAKVVLSLQRGQLPPSLAFTSPNPEIAPELPVRVVTALQPWPEGPRLAGVSSFGFGGANAHVLLQPAPAAEAPPAAEPTPPHVLLLSAHTAEALDALLVRWQRWLPTSEAALGDLIGTAALRTTHLAHRVALVAGDRAALVQAVDAAARGVDLPGSWRGRRHPNRAPRVALRLGRGLSDDPRLDPGLDAALTPIARRAAALGLPDPRQTDPASAGRVEAVAKHLAWVTLCDRALRGRLHLHVEPHGALAALAHAGLLTVDAALLAAARLGALEDGALLLATGQPPPGIEAHGDGPVLVWTGPQARLAEVATSPLVLPAGPISGTRLTWGGEPPAADLWLTGGDLRAALAPVWARGGDVAWQHLLPPPAAVAPLPPLPLQRSRHWNRPVPEGGPDPRLLTLAGRDRADLAARAARGQLGGAGPARLALVVDGPAAAARALTTLARGELPDGARLVERGGDPGRVAFLFPGQGVGLGRSGRRLEEACPAFREALAEAEPAFLRATGRSLQALLASPEACEPTALGQPALVAFCWALQAVWTSFGVRPHAVAGHSLGELTAACAAGALSLEEALALAAARGRLMAPVAGAMVAVQGPPEALAAFVPPPGLELAVINSPDQRVLAGTVAAVEALLAAPGALRLRRLRSDHPFHARAMDAVVDPLTDAARGLGVRTPALPLVSSLTGARVEALPPEHWGAQARGVVRWDRALDSLAALGCTCFVELGPQRLLAAIGARRPGQHVHTLHPAEDELAVVLRAAAALHLDGQPLRLAEPAPSENAMPQPPESARDPVLERLRTQMAARLGLHPADLDVHTPFMELGADSILLAEAVGTISAEYGLEVKVRRFFEDLSNLDLLARYITAQPGFHARNPPAAPIATAAPTTPLAAPVAPTTPPAADATAVERLMRHQLEVMADLMSRQLAALGGVAPAQAAPATHAAPAPAPPPPPEPPPALSPLMRYRPAAERARADHLDARQRAWLDTLVARYTARTRRSKGMAAEGRAQLADIRAAAGFRMTTKELLYPIVADHADGPWLWDIDGNRYLDVSMDFGVNLFGHRPPFLQAAQRAQLDRGLPLAPRPRQLTDVARRLCALTGNERAMFCPTGSEAVMTALRLARMKTGRRTVAMFRGSYHGHTDGVLAMRLDLPGGPSQVPAAPGVTPGAIADVVVLDYDTPEALEQLRALGDRLAAVLVEPVQSRAPDLRPGPFLQALRQLTEDQGAALIFDEIITGFRCHPQGAQGWFGVRADLVTYGKILGGGLPIGAIAGRAAFMDGMDGGPWQYGDASFPAGDVTFFASTFAGHPLTLASAEAILGELERRGPALQEELNRKTSRLAATLNAWLEAEQLPLRVAHFGSLFRFELRLHLDLLFFALLERGLFVWEGRNLFLSDAHTDEHVDQIIHLIQDAVRDLQRGGFLPERAVVEAPMSEAQAQLCLLAALSPAGSAAYNEAIALDVRGPLEPARLTAALRAVVERHEALRTSFDLERRVQQISPAADPILEVDRGAEGWLERFVAEPFRLSAGPLLRAGLQARGPDEHTLVLVAHHSVVDGWSMGVLVGDLLRALGGEALPPAPQPRDHVAWQATWLTRPEVQAQRGWWKAQLEGAPAELQLPGDRAAATGGGRCSLRLDARRTAAVAEVGRRLGGTSFMVLLAAWAAWLARCAQQEELVVGTPVLGRAPSGQEELVGYCTHLLPLRLRVGGSFADLVRHTRDVLLDAWDHQDLPFATLLQDLPELAPERTRSTFPSALFNLDRPPALPEVPGLTLHHRPVPVRHAKFPLALNALALGEDLALDLDHSGAFSGDLARALLEGFVAWTDAALAAPERPLSRLPALPPSRAPEVLVSWNMSGATREAPLVHEALALLPDRGRVCVVDAERGEVMTAAGLHARADALTARLIACGVEPEARVAVIALRSAALPAALLAVLQAGAAYLPLEPGLPAARVAQLLDDAGVRLILTPEHLLAEAEATGRDALVFDGPLDPVPPPPPRRGHPDQLAAVLYTSGSTGTPKGVGVTHRNLLRIVDAAPVGPDEVVLQLANVAFDASHFELWCTLLGGGRLVVPRPGALSVAELEQTLTAHGVTTAFFTAGLFNRVMTTRPAALAGMRRVLAGGEVVPAAAVHALLALPGARTFTNGYGPTETTTFAATHTLRTGDDVGDDVPIGRPLPGTQLYVLDAQLRPVAPGLPGELYVGGAGVTRGYLGRPGLTAARYVPDPFGGQPGARLYATGDRVRRDAQGALVFLGRLDHQVKVRGYRVEFGEVEAALRLHPAVREVVAQAPVGEGGSRELVVWLTLRQPIDADALRSWLAARLPAWMVPAQLVVQDQLPLTREGKVDRAALRRPVSTPGATLHGGTQVSLAALWAELLQVERPGPTDDFFRLGGHSLTVITLASRVQEQLGVELPLELLLRTPRLDEQAALIDAARRATPDAPNSGPPPEAFLPGPRRIDRAAWQLRPAREPTLSGGRDE